jgi:hypothetical protein
MKRDPLGTPVGVSLCRVVPSRPGAVARPSAAPWPVDRVVDFFGKAGLVIRRNRLCFGETQQQSEPSWTSMILQLGLLLDTPSGGCNLCVGMGSRKLRNRRRIHKQVSGFAQIGGCLANYLQLSLIGG